MGLGEKMKEISEMNELELYFVIDFCGGFIWRMNHDMSCGRIPQEDWPAIDADVVKMREQQLEAINQLPRIGVDRPLGEGNQATPEYWVWYRAWDNWKQNLTDEQWREVDQAATRGLTDEEMALYKAEAFKEIENG